MFPLAVLVLISVTQIASFTSSSSRQEMMHEIIRLNAQIHSLESLTFSMCSSPEPEFKDTLNTIYVVTICTLSLVLLGGLLLMVIPVLAICEYVNHPSSNNSIPSA